MKAVTIATIAFLVFVTLLPFLPAGLQECRHIKIDATTGSVARGECVNVWLFGGLVAVVCIGAMGIWQLILCLIERGRRQCK